MDKQTLTNLIEQSKKGSRKAMEQLMIFAHTPILFQCRRLLNDQQLAEDMTERILKTLPGQIDRIENADHFQKWLGNVTATRCMKKREQAGISEYIPDSQDLSFPSNELNQSETAQVALILADSLPEDLRICLILSACCRVSTKAIAQMTGFTEETVAGNIVEAERGILAQMQIYQKQGGVFTQSLAVGALLRAAMYGKQSRLAAVTLARKILPPVAPTPAPIKPPKKPNNTVKILLCVAVALVLLILLLICGVLMSQKTPDTKETTLPSAIATTAVTETSKETTEATSEATTEATTQATSEPTTEATTVPETTEPPETAEATEIPETTAPKTNNKPVTNTGSTVNSTPKPTTDPNYNPGQGEDGHTHDFFTVPAGQNATCTRAAKIHRLCRICQHGVTVDDPDNPPLGHDYQVNIVVQPTTASKGYTNYKCTRCSDSYDADYVDPLPAPETQPPVVETQSPTVETQAPAVESQEPVPDLQPEA